jgi:hypothetical protein
MTLDAERRRGAARFRTESVVIVRSQGRREPEQVVSGKLADIGAGGARLLMDQPLEVGTTVTVEVNFPSARQGVAKIRFDGTVVRSRSQYEIAVSFVRPGRFLRRRLEGLVLKSKESN